ncbi:MAG: hypothetical protein ACT4P8_00290 [Betaproteobacteria bacterium]
MSKNELFLYGLFFVGFLLFNYFMQQVAKRARERQEQAQQPEAAPVPEDEALEPLWGRVPQDAFPQPAARVEPARRVETVAAQPAPSPRYLGPKALFGSRQALRHAVIVMTVLGPCRALQPHDQHEGGPAPGGAAQNLS